MAFIAIRDPGRAKAFCCDTLGLPLVRPKEEVGTQYKPAPHWDGNWDTLDISRSVSSRHTLTE
jgi:hypothetical protein